MSDEAKIKRVREMRDLARRTCLNRIDVRTVDLTAIVDENDRLRARVAELEAVPGKATAAHALAMAEARGRREGAEAMRERAAALVDLVREREWTPEECAAAVRTLPLPLDDDAREDAGLVCGACGTPMSSSAADAVAYSGFPPAEGLSRPSCCDAAYPANAREDAHGDDNGR